MHSLKIILVFSLFVMCVKVESFTELNQGIKIFSTSLYKILADNIINKNFVSSPSSVHTLLSMTVFGANGKTAKQIRDALYLPNNDAATLQNYQNIINQLNRIEKVTFKFANIMCTDKRVRLKNEYQKLTMKSFFSEATVIDVTIPDLSARLINEWVEYRTNNNIVTLFYPDDISPYHNHMMLVNSIYFKGKWAHGFEKHSTKNRLFQIDLNTQVQVPTMFATGYFVHGELPDLKAEFIELPYENNDLKMVIIVPNEVNGLRNIIQNLESFNSTRLASSGSMQDLHVYLPRFKIDSFLSLKVPLQEMHITDMFSENADFTSISDDQLTVDKIIQKAIVEVNEDIGEASTSVTRKKKFHSSSKPNLKLGVFVVDRPFLFQIVHNQLGMTLFIGSVTNPNLN